MSRSGAARVGAALDPRVWAPATAIWPYRSDAHDFIALGSSFCLCGVFFWSIILKQEELTGTLDDKGLLPPALQQAFAFDYETVTWVPLPTATSISTSSSRRSIQS